MATVKTYGLKKISAADPTEDGTMPEVLTELCQTYRDSCSFVEDESTVTDEFSDQQDDPIATFDVKGAKTITFSTYDYSPETLVKLKGGTIVNGQWAEPVLAPEIYQAIEILTNADLPFQFPKCRVSARFNSNFVKNGLSLLEVRLRPLSPAEGKPAVLIGKKTP